jgi:glycosyltransferase involved in cell wall biosynthesis
MKIMLYCWAEDMKIELLNWAVYLARFPHNFIITPLIRSDDKAKYEEMIPQLSRSSKNVSVDPVYLKSRDSRFRNLIFPNVMLPDSLSILGAVKRSKPDVIVCFFVSHAYPLVLLKRILGFSLCVYAMGTDVNLSNDLLHRIMKRLIFGSCERIFAVSGKMKHRIEEYTGREVIVIPSSADLSFFRPLRSRMAVRRKWGVQTENKIILTISALRKVKGVDVLIKSFAALNLKDASLWIRGDGPERNSLRVLAASLGIEERVRFLGFQDNNSLLELYNLADLFALTSYSEGLPRALIEAMACGCIPIVTNVGDVTAVVQDGFNGFIVNPGDQERLSERVKQILSLPEETRKTIQDRARRSVENRFDSRNTINKMVYSIDALLRERAHSGICLDCA